ncbi:hypothetical protein I79_003790 [Cricetulus griseus]|uniref:Uncharacterized protein n=1 Tax=Cricetulus griseus TaxID=10029 RepID=G3H0X0_CRIGR|nr:hypothetical protein I79_003790 [Cricetulus griseus]
MVLERKGSASLSAASFWVWELEEGSLYTGRLSALGGFRWWMFLFCYNGKYSSC